MQELIDLLLPLDFSNLLTWRVLLSGAVILASIIYGVLALISRYQQDIVVTESLFVEDNDLESTEIVQEESVESEESILDPKTIEVQETPVEIAQDIIEESSIEESLDKFDPQEAREPIASRRSRLEKIGGWLRISRKASHPEEGSLDLEDSIEEEGAQDIEQDLEIETPILTSDDGDQDALVQDDVQEAFAASEEDAETLDQDKESSLEDSQEDLMTTAKAVELDQATRRKNSRSRLKAELGYLAKKGKRDEYESKLIAGLAQDPEHPQVLEYLADYYVEHGYAKRAIPLYKRVVDSQPDNHNVLWKMAKGYLAGGDEGTAEILLDRALSLHPETPKYAMDLVELYYNTDRFDQSLLLMEQITTRRPENISYYNVLAHMYDQIGNYTKLIESYEHMLRLEPSNTRLKRKLLEARTKLNNN